MVFCIIRRYIDTLGFKQLDSKYNNLKHLAPIILHKLRKKSHSSFMYKGTFGQILYDIQQEISLFQRCTSCTNKHLISGIF